jgi:peroxiredoxin Q/BCP
MRLHAGDLTPTLRVDDAFGVPVEIPRAGSRLLLLSFFRNAGCAICNLRLAHLIDRFPTYDRAGLDAVAVFELSPERVRQQLAGRNVPFPVVADPDASLYDRYGVETSAEKVAATMRRPDTQAIARAAAAAGFSLAHEAGSNFDRIPADFLIDPNGVVRIAHYAEFVTDHLPFDVIEHTIGIGMAA